MNPLALNHMINLNLQSAFNNKYAYKSHTQTQRTPSLLRDVEQAVLIQPGFLKLTAVLSPLDLYCLADQVIVQIIIVAFKTCNVTGL